MTVAEMRERLIPLRTAWDEAIDAFEALPESVEPTSDEYRSAAEAMDRTAETYSGARKHLEHKIQLEESKRDLPVDPVTADDESEASARTTDARVKAGQDQTTYRKGGASSFFLDQWAARFNDSRAAQERLKQHVKEMAFEGLTLSERAIAEAAGSGGELVAPLYLQDEFLKLARAGRAYADSLTRVPLPPNHNAINIPKLTGGTSEAAQADLGAVSSTDITTALVTFPVVTIAGQEDLARQLFDRAVPELADMVLFPDLVQAYNAKLDVQLWSGSGSSPNMTGVLNQGGVPTGNTFTYTTASPTLGGLYSKIAGAIQAIHTTRFLPPEAIWMHPSRWAWCLAQLDSNNRPLIVPAAGGPYNVAANLENVAAEAFVGHMLGLPVFVDPNIPTNLGAGTNQDVVLVQRSSDSWLLEDEPVKSKVFEEVLSNTLAIRVQLFNYVAGTHGRYAQSQAFVQGTGLATPTF